MKLDADPDLCSPLAQEFGLTLSAFERILSSLITTKSREFLP